VLPVHNIPVVRPKFSLAGDIDEAAFTKSILEAVSNMDMEPSQRWRLHSHGRAIPSIPALPLRRERSRPRWRLATSATNCSCS
jgi:hypothetical protein